MIYDNFVTHDIDMFMGKPKTGKTNIAGTYPKPMLYLSVGNDGGGRVLQMRQIDAIKRGDLKVKNLRNDPMVNRKIAKCSVEYLLEVLRDLRQPGADKFKTIVVDTLGALQDDCKSYFEINKGGIQLSQQEWGDVAKMMLNAKDQMKRFSEEMAVKFVWITHTSEQEVYETSGLNKEIRIVPDLTIKTGVKYMKDASNIFYCCRKTIVDKQGNKSVKFLTYVGAHPLMDTGTRDLYLEQGQFVENFTYDKWQAMVAAGCIDAVQVYEPVETTEQIKNKNEDEGE